MLVSKRGSLGCRVEALLLQCEGSARSSPSILPNQGRQPGSIRGKMVPLAPFQELELDTESILSYYFMRKLAVNPDQVLEKSVQHFRVSILSSYSRFGSQTVTVKKQPLALLLLLFTAFECLGLHGTQQRGKNRQALAPRNLQLRFSHSKTRVSLHLPLSCPPIKVTVSS